MILVGVRYFIRGVDDNGHVANFVETEQMMIHQGYRASFVQVTLPVIVIKVFIPRMWFVKKVVHTHDYVVQVGNRSIFTQPYRRPGQSS